MKRKEENCVYVSKVNLDGKLYEEGYNGVDVYFISRNGKQPELVDKQGVTYKPLKDDLLEQKAILLPSEAQEYGRVEDLISDIRAYLTKYCDMPKGYDQYAAYYALLSWLYDTLPAIPFFRLRADLGCGKSRTLRVLGSICYKPISLTGCVGSAPLYRITKMWGGTLLIDEGDFSDTKERSELMRTLNAGFEPFAPTIRCDSNDYDKVRAYPNYCPKLFATRFDFKDKALESRCITVVLRETQRKDIPILLPKIAEKEAATLRNKLLLFRLRHYEKINPDAKVEWGNSWIEPRIKQVHAPFALLFSALGDSEALKGFIKFVKERNAELCEERASSFEGKLIAALKNLKYGSQTVSAKAIANWLEANDEDKVTPQKIGNRLKSLGFKTHNVRVGLTVVKGIVYDAPLFTSLCRKYITDEECSDVAAVADKTGGCATPKPPHIAATLATAATNDTKNRPNLKCTECGKAQAVVIDGEKKICQACFDKEKTAEGGAK